LSWSDWPGRGTSTDTGIDVVAKNRDDDALTAIQCKVYAAGSSVPKSEIDSSISRSAAEQWTRRYVFDTAAKWSGKAMHGRDLRLAQTGLRSMFRWAKRHKVIFLDPMLVAFAAIQAARPGQIRALRLDDVDLPGHRLTIAGHERPSTT
jgi:Restriction endonuclease